MYTFIQADRTNYYHPLGFAYGPDGMKGGYPELSPTTAGSFSSGCSSNHSCPAPMYFEGDQYLGMYSNIPEIYPVTTGEPDFGLDNYEQRFSWPLDVWAGFAPFNVHLKFDDYEYGDDLFYFCHVSKTNERGFRARSSALNLTIPFAF